MGAAEAMEKLLPQSTQTKLGFQKNRVASEEEPLQTQIDCSECGGTGTRLMPNGQGGEHAVPCECAIRDRINRQLNRIAPRDRWARIDSLSVCEDPSKCFAPLDLQRQIIDILRANPDGSFAFFGPSGYGKTTYLAALWHRAVTQTNGRGSFYQQTHDLVRELRSYEFDKDETPRICRQVIRETIAKHLRPRVFLDEFDKVSPTDFARNSIHELVDELYQVAVGTPTGVQFILATNLDRDEFMDAWGASILRRVEAICESVFDFFPELDMVKR
jgi:DNA replication protein DnaC